MCFAANVIKHIYVIFNIIVFLKSTQLFLFILFDFHFGQLVKR